MQVTSKVLWPLFYPKIHVALSFYMKVKVKVNMDLYSALS